MAPLSLHDNAGFSTSLRNVRFLKSFARSITERMSHGRFLHGFLNVCACQISISICLVTGLCFHILEDSCGIVFSWCCLVITAIGVWVTLQDGSGPGW